MTEFSTRSMLDVVVSERSLSDARSKVEDEMGRSVRADVDPSVSGRNGRSGQRSVTDIFESQTDLLVQIRDTLEQTAFDAAGRGGGGGGNTIIGGLGGAASTAAVGAITVAGLPLAEYLKNQITDGIPNLPGGGGVQRPSEGAGVPLQISTDPLSILQNVGEGITQGFADASPQFRRSVLDAVTNAFSSSGSVLERAINATGIGDRIAQGVRSTLTSFQLREPDWLRSLTSFRLEEPNWLRDLTSFRLQEPEWVSTLTSALGGGGGGGGSGPPAGARTAAGANEVNVSVDGSGLQRDLQNAFLRAVKTRDFEQFVVGLVRDELS